MKNYLLFIIYITSTFTLSAQTQRFSSENIDSLLIAYKSHEKIGLPKAYCLDQIVRFYSNRPEYLERASEYIIAYKSISEALKNNDLITRCQYRNARLNFLLSGNQTLDTTTYGQVYEYFKANDPTFCLGISSTMVNYVSQSGKYYPKSEEYRGSFLKWMELVGDDHLFKKNPLNAAQCYWITSQRISYDNPERARQICRKAIKAFQEGAADPYKISEAYRWLSDLTIFTKDIPAIRALEKEVKNMEDERIAKGFYSILDLYTRGDSIQKEKDDLKIQQLLEIRDSSMVVDLPQGKFLFDEYEDEELIENRSIEIYEDTIYMSILNATSDRAYNTTYKVLRKYPIQGNLSVLAMDQIGESDPEREEFLVMHFHNQRLAVEDHVSFGGHESTLKGESKIDEMLLFAKNALYSYPRYDSLIPLSIAYFGAEEYDQLKKLPRIPEDQFEEFKTEFIPKLPPSDDKKYSAYELFILDADGFFEVADPQLVLLRETMIEQGFNPFSSIPYFIFKEAEHVEGPNQGGGWIVALVFLFGMILNTPGVNHILMILAICGFAWGIYRFIKLYIDRKKDDPATLARSHKSFFHRLISIVGIGGLIIAGGYIGFWTGWNLTDNEHGGGTIITIGVALLFIPIGAALGFGLGFFLLLKKKKN